MKTIPQEPMYRHYTFERAAINEAARSVEVSFSSETDTVTRWGEPEILDHTGANLARLNSMGVVLYNHERDDVLGRVTNARIENGRGLATLVFDDDDESEKVFRKVVSGTLKGVSVSYTMDEYTWLGSNETSSDGRFQGPCLLVKRWTALEISIVSVPADATVGVGRSNESLRQLIESIIDERACKKKTTAENSEVSTDDEEDDEEMRAELFWIESQV